MAKKVEINEDDLKKVILMLKLSKPYLKVPPHDLRLSNLWRVAPKLADKFLKKTSITLVRNRGRITFRPKGELSDTSE